MARLPQPGTDDGVWGNILNDYLQVSLKADGTVRDDVITAAQVQDNSLTGSQLQNDTINPIKLNAVDSPSNGEVLAYNNSQFEWVAQAGGSVPDASGATKGIVKLSGDLGGTADSPTVPGLANKQDTDADLTAIASLTPTDDDILQRKSGAWTNRTPSQVKTDLSLSKTDVGLANVDNTSDANKPVSTAQQTALGLKADTTVTDGLNTRVTSLESAGIVALTDGASIATDASAGKHFRVTVAGDRTLAAPTNAADGMHRVWEITASAADRSLTLSTGSSGSFELTTNITSPITITSSKTLFLGAIYNASRSRWTVLASKATT